MKKIFLLFSLFTLYLFHAQEIEIAGLEKPSKESLAYHEYRIENSVPSYGLSKVKKLISKLEPVYLYEGAGKYINDYCLFLSDKDFSKLSVKEKFTYTMINPEYMPQVFAVKRAIIEEDKKIFGNLPLTLDKGNWSDRQHNFLKENRKEIIELIKESALKDKRLGLNYKTALEEINAVEAIPFLVNFYTTKDKKDKDILTLLILLVKKNKYHPFTKSNIYRSFYGDDRSYFDSCIDYSETNEEYIIKTANNFYLQLPKNI